MENVCPVCRARFRGTASCSRCGADLTALMTIAASAFRLRQAARESLLEGDFDAALEFATEAQRTQRTEAGSALVSVGMSLAAISP